MAPMLQAERHDEMDSEIFSSNEDIEEDTTFDSNQNVDPLSQARSQARQASNLLNSRPSPAQVAQLRSGYSALLQTLKTEHRQLVEPQNDRLLELIGQANELHKQVQRTVDASLDARFMAASADLGAEKLHSLPKSCSPFTVNDLSALVDRIIKGIATDPFLAIGKAASRHWRGVYGMETSMGLLDQETAKRTRTVTRRDEQRTVGPAVHPTVLSTESLKQGQQKETTDLVIEVYEQLTSLFETSDQFSLFQLICDPTSYARSVELLFYISFLVADNRLLIKETADDILVSLNSSSYEHDGGAKKRHRIVSVSMKEWQTAIKRLCIKVPLIKLH